MREANRQYYQELFERYGDSVRTVWHDSRSQQARFSVLCRIGNLVDSRILDVGCGFGDLLDHLRDRGTRVKDYLGIDCVDEMLTVARKRHPSARFENVDLFQFKAGGDFDWVLGSGLFTLKGGDSHEYALQTVRKMFSLARKGIGVNFLSCLTARPDGFSNYCNPADTLQMLAHGVSPIFEIIHNYRPNDFTVFLYREYQKDGQ